MITTPVHQRLETMTQDRVRTSMRRGGQFCCSFIANLLQYLYVKNYQNIMWLDKVIAKIKRVHFLPHNVDLIVRSD